MTARSTAAGIRPAVSRLWSADRAALEAHYLRLDVADRRMRFFGPVSDSYIRAHCKRIDWSAAAMAGAFADGGLRGVAELRFSHQTPRTGAEVAVSVDAGWRRRGIGEALFGAAMALARNRLVGRISVVCLAENTTMRRLAARCGVVSAGRSEEVLGAVDAAWPSPVSFWREAALNRESLFRASAELAAGR